MRMAGNRSERGPWLALFGLGAVAAVSSLAIARLAYPLGSINHDEPMYVFSARLLQSGRLTLPASYAPFRPWASGVRDGKLVLKYTPVWPSVLALGGKLGSMRLGAALASAAAVVLIGLLGRELFGRWREGPLAGGFLLLSPLFVFQSGTYLPYVFQLALDLAVMLLVLGALRRWPSDNAPVPTGVVARLLAAGFLWGGACFARPYDAFLLAIPIAAAVIVAWRRRLGRLLTAAGWTGLGAILPIGAFLAYNTVLMGGPLRSTFSVTGPDDRLGFGPRGVFASSTFRFTRGDAVTSLSSNLGQFPGWVFGGVVLVALALFGLWRHRRGGPAIWAIAGVAVSFAFGYAAFWSPYSIVKLWPGSATMGPFYHLPLLIPVVLFGAAGLTMLFERDRALGSVAVALLVLVTAVNVGVRIDRNRTVTRDYEAVQRLVNDAHLGRAVLFMPDRGQNGYESAAPFLENLPSLRQSVVYALDDGSNDFAVIDRYPDRAPARMRAEVRPGDQLLHPTRFVERLGVVRGESVFLRFRIVNTVGSPTVLATLDLGNQRRSVVLDTASVRGRSYDVTWTLRGATTLVRLDKAVVVPAGSGVVDVGAEFRSPDRTPDRYRVRYPYETRLGNVSVLVPGIGQYLYQFGAPTWVDQAIAPTLHALPPAT
jgi:4-amino-4-deoxy-L-arabinose transferase-like glycosyltransferase